MASELVDLVRTLLVTNHIEFKSASDQEVRALQPDIENFVNRHQSKFYTSHDKVYLAQQAVEETKQVMVNNVRQVVENNQMVLDMESKSHDIKDVASDFQNNARLLE